MNGKWDKTVYLWHEDRAQWTADDGATLRYLIHEECKALMVRNMERWEKHAEDINAKLEEARENNDRSQITKLNGELQESMEQLKEIQKTKSNFGDTLVKQVASLLRDKLAAKWLKDHSPFDQRREVFVSGHLSSVDIAEFVRCCLWTCGLFCLWREILKPPGKASDRGS